MERKFCGGFRWASGRVPKKGHADFGFRAHRRLPWVTMGHMSHHNLPYQKDPFRDARGLPSHELVASLRAERDAAQSECEEHMTGEGRLQQWLADAEVIMNHLARSAKPAAVPQSTSRAEKIADPDRFDGTQEKLKVFKNQLMLKTSGSTARFPNTQYKLRYTYQFLTGKAQRAMRIHLRRTADPATGEETYEIAFDTFAAFLTTLDRHFGDPDEKHTASLALDKLRQSNQEFGAYYADFQELMDILRTTDNTSRHHALK